VNDDADDADDADDLAALHDNLASTAELPVERSASRWLSEAEALAADLRESDLPDDVVADRLATIEKLLRQVGNWRPAEPTNTSRPRENDSRTRARYWLVLGALPGGVAVLQRVFLLADVRDEVDAVDQVLGTLVPRR